MDLNKILLRISANLIIRERMLYEEAFSRYKDNWSGIVLALREKGAEFNETGKLVSGALPKEETV